MDPLIDSNLISRFIVSCFEKPELMRSHFEQHTESVPYFMSLIHKGLVFLPS
jgi:hypothetical protein